MAGLQGFFFIIHHHHTHQLMEIWDLYTDAGELTGETAIRSRTLPPDRYHLVVHLWIRNSQGEYLIQKRSPLTQSKQGMWAFTGGSATTGDSSFTAIQREAEEEIGLVLTADHHPVMVRRSIHQVSIVDQWMVDLDVALDSLALGPEVDAVRYASEAEIRELMREGMFWPLEEEYLAVVFGA